MNLEPFFYYARARHQITVNRKLGKPREDWTSDPILQRYRFTSVFRELDKTTAWFAEHFREPWRNQPEVLLGTVVFRMLNRIEVGEAIFCQNDMFSNGAAFFDFVENGDVRILRKAIKALIPSGPYVTGAYIITSYPGMPKLDGVLEIIKRFYKGRDWERILESNDRTLHGVWETLKSNAFFGGFHSYEIVTDLRHTYLLENASDINLWANIGPGCRRGLARIIYGKKRAPKKMSETECLDAMATILESSRSPEHWPRKWPVWEMREVEHTLCEWDKYERVRLNEGRPRGVFSK